MNRVELHTHTTCSTDDGLIRIPDLLSFASQNGMKAVAITDHGSIGGFSEASQVVSEMKKQQRLPDDFKMIYGVEAYLVDDLTGVVMRENGQSISDDVVVIDIETTGFSAENDSIIEIGAIKLSDGQEVENFYALVKPENEIPQYIEELTGISNEMVQNQPSIEKILPQLIEFVGDCVVVGHNVKFDVSFLLINASRFGLTLEPTCVDTLPISRLLFPHAARFRLASVAEELGIEYDNLHRVVDDARLTAQIYLKLVDILKSRALNTWKEVNEKYIGNSNAVKRSLCYHATILAKDRNGLENLQHIVEVSEENYYYQRPRIPKSLLQKYREGLLVGSACEAGELYSAVIDDKSEAECIELAKFYDYIELQPISNNKFMCENERYRNIHNKDDLQRMNRLIIEIGNKLGKPVVATSDAHYLRKEDSVKRVNLLQELGFEDVSDCQGLHIRTTKEMLHDFEYLGEKEAHRIVVENTNKIADMISNDIL